MLLTFEQLIMMKGYNQVTRQYEVKEDLTDEQRKKALNLDNWFLENENRHLISNYEILKKD